MKRIDYFWARAAVKFTGIIFTTQVVTEVISTRKQGFEWVLPASATAFGLAILMMIVCVAWNAAMEAHCRGGNHG